jgi:hypothetical protein
MVNGGNLPEEQTLIEVNSVIEYHFKFPLRMVQTHVGNERVFHVIQFLLPDRTFHPGKAAIGPDSSTVLLTSAVVFLAYIGVEQVPQTVLVIEIHLEFAVANNQSSGHLRFLNYALNSKELLTRMTKLPNKKAGDNIGKNLRGKPHVVTPTLQG